MGFKTSRRAIDALSLAIATGAPRAARERIASRPDLAKHWRPLHEACFHGRGELARLLLEHGADPNAVSPKTPPHYAMLPLHRSIEQNATVPRGPEHEGVVRLLLERGADPNARGGELDLAPLPLSAFAGVRRFAAPLLGAGAKLDVYSTAALGDVEGLEVRLREVPHVDVPDQNGLTALHYAAASAFGGGDLTVRRQLRAAAAKLLEAGASLELAPPPTAAVPEHPYLRKTALEWAVLCGGNIDVVRLLLERGADPSVGDLLLFTLMREETGLASLLLHYGADVDRLTERGAPPIVVLSHWGRGSMVEWLLFHGADPNVRSTSGDTALLAAVRRGLTPRTVKALLARGADRELRDAKGRTARDLAQSLERGDLFEIL